MLDVTNPGDWSVRLEDRLCDKCAKSIKIGRGVIVDLCYRNNCDVEWDYEGTDILSIAGPYNTGEIREGKDNWASHMRIRAYNPAVNPVVNLF